MEFKDRLKELRESKKLSQKDLATGLNRILNENPKIYTQTISYWENGREPSYSVLVSIAKYFEVPTAYLLGQSDSANLDEFHLNSTISILDKNVILNNLKKYPENISEHLSDIYTSILEILNPDKMINHDGSANMLHADFIFLLGVINMTIIKYYEDIDFELFSNTKLNKENIGILADISKESVLKTIDEKSKALGIIDNTLGKFIKLSLEGDPCKSLFLEYAETYLIDNKFERVSLRSSIQNSDLFKKK